MRVMRSGPHGSRLAGGYTGLVGRFLSRLGVVWRVGARAGGRFGGRSCGPAVGRSA